MDSDWKFDLNSLTEDLLPSQHDMVRRKAASPLQQAVDTKVHPFPVGEDRDLRICGKNDSFEMELCFLGTASCIPTSSRKVSSSLLRYNGDSWLFDVGECSQLQIQSARAKPSAVTKIFLTHMHGDHVFGLPGMMCLLGASASEDPADAKPTPMQPVDIYGPEGTRDYIRASMQLTYSRITIPYRVHELMAIPSLQGPTLPPRQITTAFDPKYGERPGGTHIFPDANGVYTVVEGEGELSVKAAPLKHLVPCVGYAVVEKDKKGALQPDIAKAAVERNWEALKKLMYRKDPNKVYGVLKKLQPGEAYTFPDGTVIKSEDINGTPRKGRKVVILGDTCNADRMTDIAMDADVLVHEATNAFLSPWDKGTATQTERETIQHGHSTPEMAGRFAAHIGARKLVLNHFSSRYPGDASETSMNVMWQIENKARRTSGLHDPNGVIAAWDFMVLPILMREERTTR